MIPPACICLWFDDDAQGAAEFYAATFPDTRITAIQRSPSDYHSGQQGQVLTVEFTLMGIFFFGLNGGPHCKPTQAFSIQIATDDQAETDRLWHAIVDNGGSENACGWCQDRWGYSWQITPRALTEGMADPDREAAGRVMQAMMTMHKIDIAAIEAARRGTS